MEERPELDCRSSAKLFHRRNSVELEGKRTMRGWVVRRERSKDSKEKEWALSYKETEREREM